MYRILTLLLLLCGMQSMGQSLTGKVLGKDEFGTGIPLPGAYVVVPSQDKGVTTDLDGVYKISGLRTGDVLVFSYIGYESDTLIYNNETEFDLILERGIQIEGAEVETEKGSTEMSLINPLNIQFVSEEELTKAACCNLSESFETNASIDAAITDAVSGTRQIRMLGLDGKYSQIMKDNMPTVRGLTSLYGLTYIPGAWIESILISKGVGSVTNGFESITGQLNVVMKSPENAERLYVNAYGNQGGRVELNTNIKHKVNDTWSTTLLTHGEWNDSRQDRNGDGFLDNPLKKDVIVRNEWQFRSLTGWEGEYQGTFLSEEVVAGQEAYVPNETSLSTLPWGMEQNTKRGEFSAKTGKVFKGKPGSSFGSQISGVWHNQESVFGSRVYAGEQKTLRVNLLYNTLINTSDHNLMSGGGIQYDDYIETLDSMNLSRTDIIPGVFSEYTFKSGDVFTLIAGIRADQHQKFGTFISPRLHARYSITENSAFKLAAGKGFRTSNIIMEHVGILASSREIIIGNETAGEIDPLKPEEAWNFGLNMTNKFRLNYRDALLALDFYHTRFENQVVMDLENPREARFYNLNGESYSNSAQVEFSWSPWKRWDIRLAYRWLDVKTDYSTGLLAKPLVSTHRAFSNIAFETRENPKGGKWKFDATTQWIGDSRIPSTSANPEEYQLKDRSDAYIQLSGQVTRVFSKSFDFYVGVENATNFRQPNAILAANDPYGEFFDASLVWGPVFGSMTYAGLRYKIE